MEIVNKNINDLHPYELNAKKHPLTQINNVAESIKQFGWQQPIVIDKDGIIIIGHCRYYAAQKLALTEVPCVVADLTEYQARKLRLLDNKLNESEWDWEALKLDIDNGVFNLEFDGFDIDWGIPQDDEDIEIREDNYDIDANINENPKSKKGEIYQLGEHRLMCGDSTDINDVNKLLNGEQADLLFTDPPYNVNVSNSQGMTIENDNMDKESFREFLNKAFNCMSENVKDGGAFYVWHADSETVNFRTTLEENDLLVKQCLIWVKNGINFGRQDYKWKHEPCLYGWKEGAGHYFIDDRTQTTVINENKPARSELHPTMKPIKLFARLIKNSSRRNERVLDIFGGSGTTLITCEQLGRISYTMEYDPHYVDVIIDRFIKLTGNKVYRINQDGTKTNWEDVC